MELPDRAEEHRKELTPLSSVACGVHSEHILKEQSDAQNVVSRFPFRGHPLAGL